MRIFRSAGIVVSAAAGIAVLFCMLTAIGPTGTSVIGSTRTLTDTVVNVFESGMYDISFSLKNDKRIYYINRGLEHGLNIEAVKKELLNRYVTISYVHQPTMALARAAGHINQLACDSKIIYSELRRP